MSGKIVKKVFGSEIYMHILLIKGCMSNSVSSEVADLTDCVHPTVGLSIWRKIKHLCEHLVMFSSDI